MELKTKMDKNGVSILNERFFTNLKINRKMNKGFSSIIYDYKNLESSCPCCNLLFVDKHRENDLFALKIQIDFFIKEFGKFLEGDELKTIINYYAKVNSYYFEFSWRKNE